MPWKSVGTKIVRSDTGKVVGHSSSPEMAKKAVKARYANSPEFNGDKKKKSTVYHACGKKCDGGKMMSK